LKNPKELNKAVEGLVAENAEQKKKLEKAEARQLAGLRAELSAKAQLVNGTQFIGEIVEVGSADALKKLCFDLKGGLTPPYVAVLAANVEGKAAVAVLTDEQSGLQAP